jgi:hypothetical protein
MVWAIRQKQKTNQSEQIEIGGPGRSVTHQCDQVLSAKVRQLGAFEGKNEISVGVAPFHERPFREAMTVLIATTQLKLFALVA